MNRQLALLSLLVLFLGASSRLLTKQDLGLNGYNELNPYKSDVTYNESNLIDATALNLPFKGEMRTGYITANNQTNAKYYYTLYAAGGATNAAAKLTDAAPLILWMQGGPGCSDASGMYTEIGPFAIVNKTDPKTGKVEQVAETLPYNWNDKYHLLFIDNPVGVGYSVGLDNVTHAYTVAEYVQTFLIRFFQIYTGLKSQDFYVFAESFGGHYGPAVVSKILSNITNNGFKMTGLGIVDGWVNPYYQSACYSEYTYAAGLIDPKIAAETRVQETLSQQKYIQNDPLNVANVWNNITLMLNNEMFSPYDYRKFPSNDPAPFQVWLNLDATKKGLGVDSSVYFNDCVDSVYNYFSEDIGTSYADNISYILTNAKPSVKVLIMNGADDYIVNTIGVRRYIKNLQWAGAKAFNAAERTVWYKDQTKTEAWGAWKRFSNLNFAIVYKAGHEVPMYAPESARNLLERFMNDDWTQ